MAPRFALSIRNLSVRQLSGLMVAVFALVHVIYYALGIRIDTSFHEYTWILYDLNLEKNALLQSAWYSHAYPPGFNIFVGIVMKVFPGYEQPVYQVIYLALGLGFYFSVYYLMRQFNISRLLALVISTLFMMSPSSILLEHQVAYDWPLTVLLTFSTVLLYLFLGERKTWTIFLFFGVLGLMCITRTIFHLLFFGVIFIVVLVISKGSRKMVVTAAILPFLLVFSIYLKNYFIFHKFTAGTGLGPSAAKVLIRSSTVEQRKQWVADGIVSEIFLIEPNFPLALYPERFRNVKGFEGIPILREPVKRDSVSTNQFHLAYIAINDQYLKDAISVIKHYPRVELFGLAAAWYCYFRSTSENIFLNPNRERILWLVNVYDYLFFGKYPGQVPFRKGYNLYAFLLVGLPLLYLFGFVLMWKGKALGVNLDRRQRTIVTYMFLNIVYIAVLTNSLELAENQRGQYYTFPFVLVFLGMAIEAFLNWRRSRRAGTPEIVASRS